MGILDKIKDIGGGIKKVFEKVMSGLGKFFNSKIGKIIMIAASVVTAGMALYGAYAGMMAGVSQGGTFMSQFLNGAAGFLKGGVAGYKAAGQMFGQLAGGQFGNALNTLKGVGDAGRAAVTGSVVAGGAQSAAAGGVPEAPAAGIDPGQVIQGPGEGMAHAGQANAVSGNAATNTAQGWQLNPQGSAQIPGTFDASSLQPSVVANGVPAPALPAQAAPTGLDLSASAAFRTPAATQPGFLSKLGTAMKDTITSPTGLLLAGQMATSVSANLAAEDLRKDEKKAYRNSVWQQGDVYHPEQYVAFYDKNPWANTGNA